MYIQITHIDDTRHLCLDKDTWHEYDGKKQKLFTEMQREYGRCISKMFVDRKNLPPLVIGWVFEKFTKYEDSSEKFIKHTWVEVAEKVEHVPEHWNVTHYKEGI